MRGSSPARYSLTCCPLYSAVDVRTVQRATIGRVLIAPTVEAVARPGVHASRSVTVIMRRTPSGGDPRLA